MSGWIDAEYMRVPVPNVTRQMSHRAKRIVEEMRNERLRAKRQKRRLQSFW